MQFILASTNKGKVDELNSLFHSFLNIVIPEKKIEVDETGESFHENALLKARAYYEEFGSATLSDDSGLVVEALPDELGVYSARFAPEYSDYEGKCSQVIEKLKNKETRAAYFVCVLCFYLSEREYYFFEGRLLGEISHEMRGSEGFGYDPIFKPESLNNQTLAENSAWKKLNSHRAKAAEHALKFFTQKA